MNVSLDIFHVLVAALGMRVRQFRYAAVELAVLPAFALRCYGILRDYRGAMLCAFAFAMLATSAVGHADTSVDPKIRQGAAPTVTKTFSPPLVYVGGVTQMEIALTNSNNFHLTGVQFTDSYPAGMANATNVPGGVIAQNTCGGTLTADPGLLSATLVGGTIPASDGCKVVLNVTGTAGSNLPLTNHTGPVTSSEAAAGVDATASLSVSSAPLMQSPSVTVTLLPDTITVNGQSVVEVGLSNPNVSNVDGLQFSMSYQSGHIVNAPGAIVINTCADPGGVTAVAGDASLSMTGGHISGGGFCLIGIEVVGATVGDSNLDTGPVLSAEAMPAAGATATMHVTGDPMLAAPTLQKSFAPIGVKIGGTTQMTLTLTNSDPQNAVTGVQVEDVYPFGITNAPAGALVRNTCGGQLTLVSDNPDYNVLLLNGTIPAGGTCDIAINVVGTDESFPFNEADIISAGNAPGGGFGNATMAVTTGPLLDAPSAANSFDPVSVVVGAPSTMTITLSNATAFDIQGAQFNDVYPAGITNASGANGTVVSNSCSGTVIAPANGNFVGLVNGTIPFASHCDVVINVIGTAPGQWINQTGPIPAANAQTGASTIGALQVQGGGALLAAPTVSKTFNPSSVPTGGLSNMTLTLTNNDPSIAVTGVQLTDPYPSGLANAQNNVIESNSCGGTVTAPQGGLSVSLANATIPAGGTCAVSIKVVGTTSGSAINHTGPVNSANANPGADASAMLVVTGAAAGSDLILAKSHVGNFTQGQIGATYSLMVSNVGGATSSGTITVVDTLPPSLTATGMSGSGWSCDIAATTCTSTNPIASGASSSAITLIVNVDPNAPSAVTNNASVSGGGELNVANDTAADSTTIMPSQAANAASITVVSGSPQSTVINTAFGQPLVVMVSDASNNPVQGAAVSFTTPPSSGPSASCQAAPATDASGYTQTSCIANGLAGAYSVNATVDGAALPSAVFALTNVNPVNPLPDLTLTKSHVGHFSQGQSGAIYTLLATNVGGAATAGTVTVADTLPASLTATEMSGVNWTCDIATVSCTSTDAIGAGSSFPTITLKVSVGANAPPAVTNQAIVSGGGETNISNDSATDPTAINPVAPLPAAITASSGTPQSTAVNTAFAQPLIVLVTDASNNPVAGVGVTFAPPASGASANCQPSSPTDAAGRTQTTCVANGSLGSYQVSATVTGAALVPANFALTNTNGGGGGGNHAPVAVADAIQVAPDGFSSDVVGDANATDSVLDNDIDPDAGDTLTAIKLSDPIHGQLTTFNIDGTFQYHNTSAAATDSFTYQACDNHNACSAPTNVTITIGSGLSDHVPFAVDDAIDVAHGDMSNALIGDPVVPSSVVDNDIDPDGDPLTVSKLTDPSHGVLAFNGDGTFTYQNDGADPATSDGFLYQACDVEGACDMGVVTITIGNGMVDHAPVVVDDAIQLTPPNNTTSTLIGDLLVPNSVLDNDSDSDPGDTLSAVKMSNLFNESGSMSLAADGTFTYQNTDPTATSDRLLYEACDVLKACSAGTVTISITNAAPDLLPISGNDQIIVGPHGTATALVGDANVPSSVLDNDHDPDAGDTLNAHLISAPLYGHVTLHADGTFVYVNDDPAPGSDSWQYEACDTFGACAAASVSVTVNANAPTVVCTLRPQIDMVGDAVSIDLSQLFLPPSGETLSYGVTSAPPALSVVGSLLSGTLTVAGTYAQTSVQATTVPGGVSAGENVMFQVLPAGDILFRNGFDNSTQTPPLVCQ